MRYVLTPNNNPENPTQQETEWWGDDGMHEEATDQTQQEAERWEDRANDAATAANTRNSRRTRPSRPHPRTDWKKVYEIIGVMEVVLRLVVPCAGLCACWPLFCWAYGASSGGDEMWSRMKIVFIVIALVGLEFWFGILSNLIWQVILFVATKLEGREEAREESEGR